MSVTLRTTKSASSGTVLIPSASINMANPKPAAVLNCISSVRDQATALDTVIPEPANMVLNESLNTCEEVASGSLFSTQVDQLVASQRYDSIIQDLADIRDRLSEK